MVRLGKLSGTCKPIAHPGYRVIREVLDDAIHAGAILDATRRLPPVERES
jgi:hypothetical protein